MATKKIRIDFSKVEERSAWSTKQMPEGMYAARIASVEQTKAQDGTDMLVYALQPTDSQYRNRLFPYYCKLQANQLWKLRDLLVAGGMDVPRKAQQIDPEKVVGSPVAIYVGDDTYNGIVRSSVTGVYLISAVEDSEPTADEEEADDFDDDEDFDEEDFDDDEDFDEDEVEEAPKAPKKSAKKSAKKR